MNNNLKLYISELENWVKERKKDAHYSLEQFDKLIIMLSSGGLVLTIGFVRDIVSITEKTNTILLKTCWYLLALALVVNLLSQILSFLANKFEIKRTTLELNDLKTKGEFNEDSRSIKMICALFNISNLSIKIFNVLSFILLIVGISSFVIFVNQNI